MTVDTFKENTIVKPGGSVNWQFIPGNSGGGSSTYPAPVWDPAKLDHDVSPANTNSPFSVTAVAP